MPKMSCHFVSFRVISCHFVSFRVMSGHFEFHSLYALSKPYTLLVLRSPPGLFASSCIHAGRGRDQIGPPGSRIMDWIYRIPRQFLGTPKNGFLGRVTLQTNALFGSLFKSWIDHKLTGDQAGGLCTSNHGIELFTMYVYMYVQKVSRLIM